MRLHGYPCGCIRIQPVPLSSCILEKSATNLRTWMFVQLDMRQVAVFRLQNQVLYVLIINSKLDCIFPWVRNICSRFQLQPYITLLFRTNSGSFDFLFASSSNEKIAVLCHVLHCIINYLNPLFIC